MQVILPPRVVAVNILHVCSPTHFSLQVVFSLLEDGRIQICLEYMLLSHIAVINFLGHTMEE